MKYTKQFLIMLALFIAGCLELEPEPIIKIITDWDEMVGGSRQESDIEVIQMMDGNYVVLGWTNSEDGLLNPTHGGNDICLMKYTSNGSSIWQYSYGGTGYEDGFSVIDNGDGLVLVGGTNSRDGDLSSVTFHTPEWQQDIWIIRTDIYGKIQHQQCIGGSDLDYARSIQKTNDGGYVIAATSRSSDEDLTENNGELDFWIVKLDKNFNIQWQKTFGGPRYDDAFCIRQLEGGDYIVTGCSIVSEGDASNWILEAWIMRLNSNGELKWEKYMGGSKSDMFAEILLLDGGDMLLVGYNGSDGAEGNTSNTSKGWAACLNLEGEVKWSKTYGGSDIDRFSQAVQTNDGGFLIIGSTASSDGDIAEQPNGMTDIWLVKLSETGELVWEKTFGGSDHDYGESIIQTKDGKYIMGCVVNSDDGDIVGNHGNSDFWIKKFDISEIVE